MHPAHLAALALLATGFLAACGAGDGSTPESARLVRHDSAGIRVTESATPTWRDGQGWRVDSVPEVVIGATSELDLRAMGATATAAAAEPVLLQQVRALKVLSDGRIVVADAASAEVMVFDSAGSLVTRFGGRGQGPGELEELFDAHICGGDSIVVAERFHVQVFDDRGTFARRVRYSAGGLGRYLTAVSEDCQRLLFLNFGENPPLNSWGRAERRLAWLDPVSQAADTATSARLPEVWTRMLYGEEYPFPIPWGTSSSTFAIHRGTIVIGYGRVPEVRTHDSAGRLTSLIRWSPRPRLVTREDRQRYSDMRLEWMANMPVHPETRFLFPELDEYPHVPTERPLFDQVLVDGEGGVWLRSFPGQSIGVLDSRMPDRALLAHTWTVFDPTGVWLGAITLPERFDLRAVARGRLYGVAKDSFDMQTVQVFSIQERAASSS